MIHDFGRQGIGFSSEIETPRTSVHLRAIHEVARGLASRQRLKPGVSSTSSMTGKRRQGIGFSSEIETILGVALPSLFDWSPGDWLLVRD